MVSSGHGKCQLKKKIILHVCTVKFLTVRLYTLALNPDVQCSIFNTFTSAVRLFNEDQVLNFGPLCLWVSHAWYRRHPRCTKWTQRFRTAPLVRQLPCCLPLQSQKKATHAGASTLTDTRPPCLRMQRNRLAKWSSWISAMVSWTALWSCVCLFEGRLDHFFFWLYLMRVCKTLTASDTHTHTHAKCANSHSKFSAEKRVNLLSVQFGWWEDGHSVFPLSHLSLRYETFFDSIHNLHAP